MHACTQAHTYTHTHMRVHAHIIWRTTQHSVSVCFVSNAHSLESLHSTHFHRFMLHRCFFFQFSYDVTSFFVRLLLLSKLPPKISVKNLSSLFMFLIVGSRDCSMVRITDSWAKGLRFKSQQEWQENLLLQGQLSVPNLIPVTVPPPWYCSSM